MPKRLLKNASYSAAGQVVNMAVSILFVPAYIYFLGIEGYGIYSFFLMLFGWITMIQAGIDPAVIRMTAKYAAMSDQPKINALVTASIIFQISVASLIGVVFFLSSDYLASFIVKNEISFLHETKVALYYAGANIVILMWRNVYVAFFMGLQRYDISSVYDALFNLVASLLAIVAVWFGFGIVGMIATRLVINILSIVVLHNVAKKVEPSFGFSLTISKELLKEIYDYASWIVAGRMNRLAINALPPILINTYVGPSGIAYFNIATRIVMALNNLLSSATNVIFPFVSELVTLQDAERTRSAYLSANRLLSLVSAPLYCFGVIYSWDLLYFWLGSDVADNAWLLMGIFFVGYYLTSASMVPSNFALGMGNVKLLAFTGFIQTAIIVVTLPLLLKTFGIEGAGLNLILFEFASIVMGIIITTKIIGASNFTFWIRDRLLMLLISSGIFSMFIPLKNIFPQGVITRVEMAVYLGCVFLLGMAIYVVILMKTNLVDHETKSRLVKIVKKSS